MAKFQQFVSEAKEFFRSDAGQVAKVTAMAVGYNAIGSLVTRKINPAKVTFGSAVIKGVMYTAIVGALGATITHLKDQEVSFWRNEAMKSNDALRKAEDKIVSLKREKKEENLPAETANVTDFMAQLRSEAAMG